jgi:hypothetical protein
LLASASKPAIAMPARATRATLVSLDDNFMTAPLVVTGARQPAR